MFLDYNGAIWSCCFVANPLARGYTQHREMYNKTFSKYGENFNSPYRYNLDEILAGEYYSNDSVSSWSENILLSMDACSTCIKQCLQGKFTHRQAHRNAGIIMLYANGCSYTEGHELQQKRQSRYSNIPTQLLQIFSHLNDGMGGSVMQE